MKLYGSLSQLVAAIFRKDSNNITLRPNQTVTYGADRDVQLPEQDANSVLVSKNSSDILTNKSISGSTNTLSDIPNNATTAASANTASAIVARDANGDFSAGTITASLSGNASTATSATSATSFTGSLSGEVTGTQSATVVADDVIDNDNIKSTAAIAYSKLALTSSIVSADLAGSIDAAKISSGSVSNTEFDYLNGVTSSIQTQFGGKASSGANSDITSLSGLTTALSIGQGGTGATTASTAINALLPAQGSSIGKYLKTDGTDVSWASASGGAGEINAILNSSGADGITGWVAGTSHTTPTVITGVNNPLDPIVSTAFSFTASAGTAVASSGQEGIGIYDDITLPTALQNRKLKIEFSYSTPASSAGTWAVVLYQGSTKVSLSTNTGATPDTVLPAGVTGGKFTAYFDSINASAYRLLLVQRTRTLANNLYLTNIIVGPGIQPQGAVVGEWQSYTPTLTASGGGSVSAGTGGSVNTLGEYRRVGSSASVQISWRWGASGTSFGTSGFFVYSLPSGLSVDSSAVAVSASVGASIGNGTYFDSSTGTLYPLDVSLTSAYQIVTTLASGTSGNLGTITPVTVANDDWIRIQFTVPIAEWAGSGTVQLAQNDVEYASNSSGLTTAGGSNSAAFAYGPSGATIGSIASTTGASSTTTMRVRFQTPIQAGDSIVVETDLGQNEWVPAAQRFPWTPQNLSFYGINTIAVSGSTTDIDVLFGNQGASPYGAATYAASGQTWGTFSTWKWRVRKSSAGAAVGFGLYQPGVSAGLVSSSGLAGRANGNVVPSGFVGEQYVSTWSGQTITTGAGVTLATLSNVQPGIYLAVAETDVTFGSATRITSSIVGGTAVISITRVSAGGDYCRTVTNTDAALYATYYVRVTTAGTVLFSSASTTASTSANSRGSFSLVRIA